MLHDKGFGVVGGHVVPRSVCTAQKAPGIGYATVGPPAMSGAHCGRIGLSSLPLATAQVYDRVNGPTDNRHPAVAKWWTLSPGGDYDVYRPARQERVISFDGGTPGPLFVRVVGFAQ